ncbi:P-loop containing nucleoside triphosphate hydrolase protein [Colletotrichum sublineola]|nr:P-loop containing nucleoside triphosphate hydrolase protein [Colletotrichum sublineola]
MDVLRPIPPPIRADVSLFRGGQKARDSDIFIAVMGLTGSGKSTFVSHLTKSAVPIGSKLQSCGEVTVYQYQYNTSTNVYLVDTPGFDDTNLSDSDVLKEIASWLTSSYHHEVKLTGILYLHRITDLRMGGSAKKNLFMFKKLCGPEALKHVVLVTTMWELVDEKLGLERQDELETTEEFWGYMLSKGSRIEKHLNTTQSARHIISRFISQSRPATPVLLAIQDEMVNKSKNLDETEAGKGLEGVLARERERFKRDLEQARQDMQEALAARDREAQEEILIQQALVKSNLERLQRQQEEIKITMEKLHKEKYERLEADWKKHKKEMKEKNDKDEARSGSDEVSKDFRIDT